jgi:GntR family transcriptional regulator
MSVLQPKMASPLYVQAQEVLMARVIEKFRPGQLLPTQAELAQEFGVSLITIKRALQELARKGLVESTRGRGTVVVQPHVQTDQRGITSWTDFMTGVGRQPRTAWCRVRVRVPPKEVARRLRLKARERTVRIERLRTLDGEPFCLMTNELPLALAPRLPHSGLTEESLYGWLRRHHGLVPQSADEEVEARSPTAEEVQALGPDTDIVLVVHRTAWLTRGQPLEVADMVSPAHRYRYHVAILQKSEAATPPAGCA